MKNSWIVFMMYACCHLAPASGQTLLFTGGSGRGSVVNSNVQSTLSGSTDLVLFTGGNGRGNSVGISNGLQILNGTPNLSFTGGIGRGDIASGSGSLSMNGTPFSSIALGGIGSGATSSRSILQKLEGSSYLSISFSGGTGNGNAVANCQPLSLSGTLATQNFFGGSGNGNSTKKSEVLLLGGSLYVISYSGGNGRGNTQIKSNLISLSGVVSPGFSRISQSAILDFRAVPRNNRIRLNWRAENQEILDHFVVEKSSDGVEFNSIGFVASGSDHQTGLFSFPHAASGNGTEFFRLLEVFKDSSFSYSSVLKIATNSENELISLYPNPAREKLTVSLPPSADGSGTIQIFDYSGQLAKEIPSSGSDRVEINTEDLPAGLYWLETGSGLARNRIRFTRL